MKRPAKDIEAVDDQADDDGVLSLDDLENLYTMTDGVPVKGPEVEILAGLRRKLRLAIKAGCGALILEASTLRAAPAPAPAKKPAEPDDALEGAAAPA